MELSKLLISKIFDREFFVKIFVEEQSIGVIYFLDSYGEKVGFSTYDFFNFILHVFDVHLHLNESVVFVYKSFKKDVYFWALMGNDVFVETN